MWKSYALALAVIASVGNCFAGDEYDYEDTYEDKHHMPFTKPAIIFTGNLNLGYEFWNSASTTSFFVHGSRNLSSKLNEVGAGLNIHPSALRWTGDWPLSFITIPDVTTGIPISLHGRYSIKPGGGPVPDQSLVAGGLSTGVEVIFSFGLVSRILVGGEYIHDIEGGTAGASNFGFVPHWSLGYRF